MHCTSFSNVASYDIKGLQQTFGTWYPVNQIRDVLHLSVETDLGAGDVFFFSYGVVVFWNLAPAKQQEFFDLALPYAKDIFPEKEQDSFNFSYGEKASINRGEFVLPNPNPLTKLAFSHGLAQSAKLAVFEQTIQKTIDDTHYLPSELANCGRLPLSRKAIRQQIGKLYMERSSINLRFALLDEPEIFWDYDDLTPFYRMTARYLDIEDRARILNHKLEVVRELFEMLGNELNHQQSTRLEWTIILLIALEVVLLLIGPIH